MSRFLSVLAAASVTSMFWFTLNPALEKYAVKQSNGLFKNCFQTTGPTGSTVPTCDSDSQVKLADQIVRFPR